MQSMNENWVESICLSSVTTYLPHNDVLSRLFIHKNTHTHTANNSVRNDESDAKNYQKIDEKKKQMDWAIRTHILDINIISGFHKQFFFLFDFMYECVIARSFHWEESSDFVLL